MSQREITLTVQQGQHFLNYLSGNLRMPDKLGEDKYDVAEQSWIDEKILALKAVIMSYTARLKKPRGICFGGAELWEILKGDACGKCGQMADQWVMVDPESEIKVRLSPEAEEGVYWILLLMTHPRSPVAAGMTVLSETVWPLARAMGLDRQLSKDIGLGSKRPRRILSNDEIGKVSDEEAKK